MTEIELKRENRKYRKALRDLTDSVSQHLAYLDEVMKQPNTNERGQIIGRLATALDMANDAVLRFTFGQSFQSINQRKAKMARRVSTEDK